MTLAHEHGFAVWLALGTILQGWALAEQGQRRGRDSRRSARAWPPTGPQGQRYFDRYFLPCWPRRMGKRGRQKKG